MTEPYIPRKAGDFITAKDWNDMQTHARTDIQSHDHTGKGNIGDKRLSGEAIDPKTDVTAKNLSAQNGFIMGFSPLFNKTLENQDKEAVKVLQSKPPGTFLIAGPCEKEENSFRFYWKAADTKYKRFDISPFVGQVGVITDLDSSGNELKKPT